MKKIMIILGVSGIVIGCSATDSGKVGMANPASEYCVRNGGESINKKDESGNEYGICRLKDGVEVEEWEYYRSSKKKSGSVEIQLKGGY